MANSSPQLTLERHLKASPDSVYRAWTDPEILVKWWGPEGITTPDHALDVKVGGHWTTTMQNAEGGTHTCSGVYRVLDPPERIVFTWAWTNKDGSRGHESEVEIRLMNSGDGTLMTLVQRRFESEQSRDQHSFGWNSSFNKLEKQFNA